MEKKPLQLVMESSAVIIDIGGVLDPQKSQLTAVTGL